MALDLSPEVVEAAAESGALESWATQAAGEWPFAAQFFIVSGTPGSGKTSFLQHCATSFRARGLRVAGVLAPDDGELCGGASPEAPEDSKPARRRRRLHILGTTVECDDVLPLQLNDACPGGSLGTGAIPEGSVQVGPFLFDDASFNLARERLICLRGPSAQPVDWVLLDEVGPLELRRAGGLAPAVGELLRAAAGGELGPPQPRFLIVVRPSLRDEMVKAYSLDGTGLPPMEEEAAAEAAFFGLGGGVEGRAAAVVDLSLPALGQKEEAEEMISRLASLPTLL